MSFFQLAFICAVVVAASCGRREGRGVVCVKGHVEILEDRPHVQLIQGGQGRHRGMASGYTDGDGNFEFCAQSDGSSDVFDPILQIIVIKGAIGKCYKFDLPHSAIDSQGYIPYDMGDIYINRETASTRCIRAG